MVTYILRHSEQWEGCCVCGLHSLSCWLEAVVLSLFVKVADEACLSGCWEMNSSFIVSLSPHLRYLFWRPHLSCDGAVMTIQWPWLTFSSRLTYIPCDLRLSAALGLTLVASCVFGPAVAFSLSLVWGPAFELLCIQERQLALSNVVCQYCVMSENSACVSLCDVCVLKAVCGGQWWLIVMK